MHCTGWLFARPCLPTCLPWERTLPQTISSALPLIHASYGRRHRAGALPARRHCRACQSTTCLRQRLALHSAAARAAGNAGALARWQALAAGHNPAHGVCRQSWCALSIFVSVHLAAAAPAAPISGHGGLSRACWAPAPPSLAGWLPPLTATGHRRGGGRTLLHARASRLRLRLAAHCGAVPRPLPPTRQTPAGCVMRPRCRCRCCRSGGCRAPTQLSVSAHLSSQVVCVCVCAMRRYVYFL